MASLSLILIVTPSLKGARSLVWYFGQLCAFSLIMGSKGENGDAKFLNKIDEIKATC